MWREPREVTWLLRGLSHGSVWPESGGLWFPGCAARGAASSGQPGREDLGLGWGLGVSLPAGWGVTTGPHGACALPVSVPLSPFLLAEENHSSV